MQYFNLGNKFVQCLLYAASAGDTLCIPRRSGECATGVIHHFTSLAMDKLSVDKTKLET